MHITITNWQQFSELIEKKFYLFFIQTGIFCIEAEVRAHREQIKEREKEVGTKAEAKKQEDAGGKGRGKKQREKEVGTKAEGKKKEGGGGKGVGNKGPIKFQTD